MIKYEFHEIANMYPMADLEAFNLLKESIKTRGQEMPIVVFENQILDGRNRYKACMDLCIEPVFKVFEGSYDDALDYSIELNSGRRNLEKSQKAMVAAYCIMKSRLDDSNKIKIQDATRKYGVSDAYIKLALNILENDDVIAEQVFNGQESIKNAKKRVDIILGKHTEIDYTRHHFSQAASELDDTYAHLYSLEKRDLVNIIVSNGYGKKGN